MQLRDAPVPRPAPLHSDPTMDVATGAVYDLKSIAFRSLDITASY